MILSRSRQSFGHGQTVIIVGDDGRESTSRKAICTTNSPPPFLFHLPCPLLRSASSAPPPPPSSLWMSFPPFSKPFFECAGMNPVRNQTKGHPLRINQIQLRRQRDKSSGAYRVIPPPYYVFRRQRKAAGWQSDWQKNHSPN